MLDDLTEGGVDRTVVIIYRELERLGYRPIIIGTYALILQRWLPAGFLEETKDVDIYVDDPLVAFDEQVEKRIIDLGLPVGRSEAGGFYIGTPKPIEIVYPIHDIHVPSRLLQHFIVIKGLRVLEGHAVIVAKALGSTVDRLADAIRDMGVRVDASRLRELLDSIKDEVDEAVFRVARRRIERFIEKFYSTANEGVVTGW